MRRGWLVLVGLAFVALSVFAAARPAFAERRVAFVVGIDVYAHLGADAQLRRAVEDAEDVGDRLAKLGFIVTTLGRGVTVNQDVFLKRFSLWASDVQPGDVALFYFAGHGVGMSGTNYLVPADMPNLADADEFLFRAHAIEETDVRDRIRARGASVTILMLDACRNNPFSTADRAIASARGLQPVDSAKGVLTIYAAGYGQTALDRLSDEGDPNPNSVFTRVVMAELQKPGINLLDFSEDVREKVAALARSVGHDQVPAVDNQLLGGRSVYLSGLPPVPEPAPDEAAWHSIQSTQDLDSLHRFIGDFPQSRHRREAETRLAALDRPAAPTVSDSTKPESPQGIAPSNHPEADKIVWGALADTDRPQALKDFLRAFPQSELRSRAEARLRTLDDDAWTKAASADLAGVARYLYDFPEGLHRSEANARLVLLETPPKNPPVAPALAVPSHVQSPLPSSHVLVAHRPARPRVRMVAYVKPRVRAVHAPTRGGGGNCFSFAGERHCQ